MVPATIPEKRYRPFAPLWQLMTLSPIVAPPPMVPNIPDRKFPMDRAISCWFGDSFVVSVRSLTTSIVMTASTPPAAAAMNAGPATMERVSHVKYGGIVPAYWGSL